MLLKFLLNSHSLFKNKTETINTLNQLRYKLTTTSNKSVQQLPPTDDAFGQRPQNFGRHFHVSSKKMDVVQKFVNVILHS
jgi:hypothetical protein